MSEHPAHVPCPCPDCEHLEARVVAAETALAAKEAEHDDFVNEILDGAGDEWDDDYAAEDIAVRYVRHLETRAALLDVPDQPNPTGDEPTP